MIAIITGAGLVLLGILGLIVIAFCIIWDILISFLIFKLSLTAIIVGAILVGIGSVIDDLCN